MFDGFQSQPEGDKSIRRVVKLGESIIHSGKSELSTAASNGDIELMKRLLNSAESHEEVPKNNKNKFGSKIKWRKEMSTANHGYFVVVHDSDTSTTSDKSFQDKNQNQELSCLKRHGSEETTTPEGMDKLEWDMELEQSVENPVEQDQDDVWSSQYRWYAKILARITQNVEYTPSNSTKCSNVNDVNFQDQMGRCAIHYAADAGHLAAVKLLLKSGSKVDVSDLDNLTPLHLAANRGALPVVQALLEHGALVDKRSTDKLTPLHYASSRGHTDVVMTLIKFRASLDSLDSGDRTPLALAASRDLYHVVKVLVESGAKVNIEDVKGYTSLCEAVWHKNVPMTQLLLDYGAKLTPTPYLLHYAILHRHLEMVKVLLNAGAIVNIRDDRGSTPLIVAVKTAQPEIIKLLLNYGAYVDFCGGLSWKTPLITAIENKENPDLRVILELIEGGANIDKSCWSLTPVATALLLEKIDVTVMLLAYGASLDIVEDGSSDPMNFARSINSVHSVRAMTYVGYDLRKCDDIIFNYDALQHAANSILSCSAGVHEWLLYLKFNPLRLTEISRIAVRLLKPQEMLMPKFVSSLGLPSVLVNYLMLSDIRIIPGINGPSVRLQ